MSVQAAKTRLFPVNIRRNSAKCVPADYQLNGKSLIPADVQYIDESMRRTSVWWLKGAVDLIIPCTEISRAYYAASPRVAYHLFTGAFSAVGDHRIYNPDPEFTYLNDGIAHVKLALRIPNSDAELVARLALDPIANENARLLVARTVAISDRQMPYAVTINPPFYGHSDLSLRGTFIDDPDWPRFLVNEIVKCTAPLPYSKVVSCRDNDGRKADPEPEKAKPAFKGLVRRETPDPDREILIDEDADPARGKVPLEATDFDLVPVYKRVSVVESKKDSTKFVGMSITVRDNAVARSYSSGGTTQLSPHTPINISISGSSEGPDDKPGTHAFFRRTMELLGQRNDTSVSLLRQSFEWPSSVGEKIAWAFRNGESRVSRSVLVADVVYNASTFHLFELERRYLEESISTGLLFARDRHPVGIDSIRRLFHQWAKNNGPFPKESTNQPSILERRSIHHRASTPETFANRIFAEIVKVSTDSSSVKPVTLNATNHQRQEAI